MKVTLFIVVVLFTAQIVQAADVVNWQDTAKYYGQTKTIEGTVVATKCTPKVCFLNFDQNWKESFTAVIFASDLSKFPANPDTHYKDKKIQVTGKIKEYKGKPEIILKDKSQIKVLDKTSLKQSDDGIDGMLFARSGCCSHHGGVCGCSGDRISCCDGTLSPSCTCSGY